jgi:hypothetical protein
MKVGKAIYNILSRAIPVQQNIGFSTDTFAPSGEELITNGDFSAGVEKVLNGNFTDGTNNWTAKNSSSISIGTFEGKTNVANINITAAATNNRIEQPFTYVSGASYKVSLEVFLVSGSVRLDSRDTFFLGDFVSSTTTGQWQTLTAYINPSQSGTDVIWLRSLGAQVSQFYVNTVSIELLGEGWSLSGDVSFNTGGALFNIVNGAFTKCSQSISYTVGKSYKVSFDLTGDGSTNDLKVMDDGGSAGGLNKFLELSTATPTTHTFYFVANANSDAIYFKRNTSSGDYSFTIDNVSVQEMILTKIFPEIAPPDINPPYIVYSVVSNQPSNTKNENGEIDEASLEVYSFQDTYNKTVDLGVAVRASLDRVNGTFATVKVDSINYTNEQMDVNESRKLWAAIQDYTVRIKNI